MASRARDLGYDLGFDDQNHTYISTPRGTVLRGEDGRTIELIWEPGMQPIWEGRYHSAQEQIDKAVLEGCEPYMLKDTGFAIATGHLLTVIGSGTVMWASDYVRGIYYNPHIKHKGIRGGRWFQRMKATHGKSIARKAAALAGGGEK